MFKRTVITLIGLAILIGVPVAIKLAQFGAMGSATMEMPPETVTATTVSPGQWPRTVSAVGSLVAVQGVTVAADLGGKVVGIAFDSGARVEAGDLLARIDTSAEEAQLRSAEAAMKLALINRNRNRDLRKKKSVSQADLDAAEASYRQASAEVDTVRAAIAKKTVRAPFAGRLGLRLVNLGQFVHEGDPIVSLQTLDPIHLDFSVPQQQLPALAVGTPVRATTDAAPDQVFEGRISALNPEVDPTTRSVRVRATLDNAGERLRPGMFARVEALLPQADEVLPIPATAVLYAPYGDTVFVIDPPEGAAQAGQAEGVLRQQIVRLGRTRGDFVDVVDGLAAGERVVTSGVFKLRPQQPVVVDNRLAPKAELEPNPDNE